MKDELLFCPLGGSGEIGMNMNLFAYGKPGEHKWIMVDIGVTFADDTLPGIDLIYPDPGFIVDKKEEKTQRNQQISRRIFLSHPQLGDAVQQSKKRNRQQQHATNQRRTFKAHNLPLEGRCSFIFSGNASERHATEKHITDDILHIHTGHQATVDVDDAL